MQNNPWRKDFPILAADENGNRLVYLDSAATTQHPTQVLDAVTNYYLHNNANPHRGVYDLAMRATDAHEGARHRVAQFFHAGDDEIIFTQNTTESLNLVAYSYGMHFLHEGDEIVISVAEHHSNLVPWQRVAAAVSAKLVYLYPGADGHLTDEELDKKITDKTKAIVIINPNNPTGALYPKEVLEQIVQVAREHQLIIFSDEIYDRLVMDGLTHTSIASLAPDLFCVTFSGLSKSHMIAGYRVGWMVLSGNKRIAKDYIEGLNMLTNMRICSNVPAQSIVQTALGGHQSVNDYIVPGGRIYEQRNYIYEALNSIPGISAKKPKAAFYIFPKIDVKKFNITDDEQFALDLLKDEHLLVVHGGGFNWKNPDHFRVVYLPRIEVLKDATEKLTDFLEYYRQ